MMERLTTLVQAGGCLLVGLVCISLCGCDSAGATGETRAASDTASRDASAEPPSDQAAVKIASHGAPNPAESRPQIARRPIEITFDTIKFEMEKGEPFFRSMLTPQIEALEEQPVRLRGYILPSFQQTGIRQFVLVRDNLECCFGPGAALFDCVVVDMRPGKSTNYTVRPVTVTGTFAVRELLDPEGKHLAIYHMDGDAVD